jgi:hypothetical protein
MRSITEDQEAANELQSANEELLVVAKNFRVWTKN